MVKVYRPTYSKVINGLAQKRHYSKWYAKILINGKRTAIPLCEDKETSEKMIADIMAKRDGMFVDLESTVAAHDRDPLAKHLTDFESMLTVKGSGERHRQNTIATLRRCFDAIGADRPSELTRSKIDSYLERPEFTSQHRGEGIRKALRAFFVWMVCDRRLSASPFPTKSNRLSMPGWIYFVRVQDFVKIGFTVDPQKRLLELQTASPFSLELLCQHEGNRNKEAELHRRFAKYRVRPDGEWFHLDQEVKNYIAKQNITTSSTRGHHATAQGEGDNAGTGRPVDAARGCRAIAG